MNRLKTTLLLSLLTVMRVLMGSAIGGKTGMIFAFFMASAINFFSYRYAGDAIPTPARYNQLEAFHGHVCAGSIFGTRLGLAEKKALKEAGGTGKFSASYFDLSCPVDGIQVAAGTTYGNKALTVQKRDEHRLVLTASGKKQTVEARLTKKAEERGLISRDLGKKAKALAVGSAERLKLEREIDQIYTWLKMAPTGEVVSVSHLTGTQGSH